MSSTDIGIKTNGSKSSSNYEEIKQGGNLNLDPNEVLADLGVQDQNQLHYDPNSTFVASESVPEGISSLAVNSEVMNPAVQQSAQVDQNITARTMHAVSQQSTQALQSGIPSVPIDPSVEAINDQISSEANAMLGNDPIIEPEAPIEVTDADLVQQTENPNSPIVTDAAKSHDPIAVNSKELENKVNSLEHIPSVSNFETEMSGENYLPDSSKGGRIANKLRRFKQFATDMKDNARDSLANKKSIGHTVGGPIVADSTIGMEYISSGTNIVLFACEQQGSPIPKFLSDLIGKEEYTEDVIRDIAATRDPIRVQALVDEVNKAPRKKVYTEKPPIVGFADMLGFYFKMHVGDGFRVHPLVVHEFNADFDGDTVKIVFDKNASKFIPTPMDRIIDANGVIHIDDDFFMLHSQTKNDFFKYMKKILLDSKTYPGITISHIGAISHDLYQITNTTNSQERKGYWDLLLRDIRKAARQINNYNKAQGSPVRSINTLTSQIIEQIYEWNNEFFRTEMAKAAFSGVSEYEIPEDENISVDSKNDRAVLDYALYVVTGEIAPNFQDFCRVFNFPTGIIKNKNLQFRLTSSIGKFIKLDDSFMTTDGDYVINDEEGVAELYLKLSDMIMSMVMSGRIGSGERNFVISTYIKDRVIIGSNVFMGRAYLDEDTGQWVGATPCIPKYYVVDGEIDWDAYWDDFETRMDLYGSIADDCDVEIRTDFSGKMGSQKHRGGLRPYRDEYTRGIGFKRPSGSIEVRARWFACIYGDLRIGSLFNEMSLSSAKDPDTAAREIAYIKEYENMTVAQFCRLKEGRLKTVKKIDSVYNLLAALSDYRRKSDAEYNNTFDDSMKVGIQRVRELRSVLKEMRDNADKPRIFRAKNHNYAEFIDCTTHSLSMLHADVFKYFEMDSMEFWLNSEWGQNILSCNTEDELSDCYVRMMIEYRLSKPRFIAESMRESAKSDGFYGSKIQTLSDRYDYEIYSLRSSSPVWDMIIRDIQTDNGVFQEFKEHILSDKENIWVQDNKGKWKVKSLQKRGYKYLDYGTKEDYIDIFNNHNSILDIIDDNNLRWDAKRKILCDLMKIRTGRNYIDAEIYGMIDSDPDSLWSGKIFANYDGYNNTLEQMKKAKDDMGMNTRKAFDDIAKDVRNAREAAKKSKGTLLRRLETIKNDPSTLLEIPQELYADTLNTAFIKTFADTEKASQQDAINALVTAVSMLRSGGLFSDLAVTDDIMLGKIAKDRLQSNPLIFSWLLSNPDIRLEVYDENGSKIISRDKMIEPYMQDGISEEDAIWEFLVDHPRIAAGLRKHIANPGNEGSCHPSATTSLKESLKTTTLDAEEQVVNKAFHMLVDHPGFGSMIIASFNSMSKTSLSTRDEIMSHINSLVKNIIVLSKMSPKDADIEIYNNINFGNKPEDISEEDFNKSVDHLKALLSTYADELRIAKIDQNNMVTQSTVSFTWHLNNGTTYRAMHDVEQQLTGARTSVMTSINGSETRRNGLFAWYASYTPKEPCDAPPDQIPYEEIERDIYEGEGKYLGWATEKGFYITPEYMKQISRHAKDGMVSVYNPAHCRCKGHCCSHHAVSDLSTDYRPGSQITAMSMLMVIQRMDGTEKNLLKAKKVGVDASDSITGFSVFDILKSAGETTSWFNGKKSKIETIYQSYPDDQETGLREARTALAKMLMEHQRSRGYDDMNLGMFMNIASMLIVPRDGGIDILSASQIAYICNYGVTLEELDECESVYDIVDLFDERVNGYSPDRLNSEDNGNNRFDLEEMYAGMSVSSISKFRPVIRPISSQKERIHSALVDFTKKKIEFVRRTRAGVLDSDNSQAKFDKEEFAVKNNIYTREEIYNNHKALISKNRKILEPFRLISNWRSRTTYDGKTQWYIEDKPREEHYTILGIMNSNTTVDDVLTKFYIQPGSMYTYVVDTTGEINESVFYNLVRLSYDCGINIMFANNEFLYEWSKNENISQKRREFYKNIIANTHELRDGTFIIPFFEIGLNGMDKHTPTDGFNVGVTVIEDEAFVRMVEDSQGEFKPGDSSGNATMHYLRRRIASKTGTYKIPIATLFNQTIKEHKGIHYEVRIVEGADNENFLFNREQIDLGVTPQSKRIYNEYNKDFEQAWDNWKTRMNDNPKSYRTNCRPGNIAGWAQIKFENGDVYFAPIRPFRLDEGKGSPQVFNINDITVNPWTMDVEVEWKHEQTLLGSIFKFFEGRNPSNKFIIDGNPIKEERKIRSGNHIDIYVGKNSTASRRMTNLKNDTMYTLVAEARMAPYGYNFAEYEGSFPNPEDADFKNGLLTGTLSYTDWKNKLDVGNITFLASGSDRNGMLNAWLNGQCRHCLNLGINPSIWLASRFNKVPHHLVFRYDVMFTNSGNYQDCLQSFFNLMMPSLCEDSVVKGQQAVSEKRSRTLFGNDEQGNLVIEIPHVAPNGQTYYVWEHMFTSIGFTDQHYSKFSKPQISGSHASPSALITAGYSKKYPNKRQRRYLYRWTMSEQANRIANDNSIYLSNEDDNVPDTSIVNTDDDDKSDEE